MIAFQLVNPASNELVYELFVRHSIVLLVLFFDDGYITVYVGTPLDVTSESQLRVLSNFDQAN